MARQSDGLLIASPNAMILYATLAKGTQSWLWTTRSTRASFHAELTG